MEDEELEQEEIQEESLEIVEEEIEQPEEEIVSSSSTAAPNFFHDFSSKISSDTGKRIADTIRAHKNNQMQKPQSNVDSAETPDSNSDASTDNDSDTRIDISSNNNQNQKQSTVKKVHDAATEVAGQAVSKAASAALQAEGVPTPVADIVGSVAGYAVEEKLNKKTISQKILEFLGFPDVITVSPRLSRIIVGGTISTITTLIVFILLFSIFNNKNSNNKFPLLSYLAYGVVDDNNVSQTLTEYLMSSGYCKSTTNCWQTPAYEFYASFRSKIEDKINELDEKYKGCNVDSTIGLNEEVAATWLATLLFHRAEDELLSSYGSEKSTSLAQYKQEMDFLIDSTFGFDETNDEENNAAGNSCPMIDMDKYHDNITKLSGYIDLYRDDLEISTWSSTEKEEAYAEILKERDAYLGINIGISGISGYAECSGVTVGKVDNKGNIIDIIGTYSLEDYIAGVLTAEFDGYPIEAMKAQAVAARTYVLNKTNSCQNVIGNSSYTQNFKANASATAKQATNATAGEILVDALGNIFSAEYDSWNCKGSTTCTYTKKPNGEKHTVTISNKYLSRAAGGHGRGMSQLAAADMADKGSNYREILSFFYSDGVQITNLTKMSGPGLSAANPYGFRKRISQPAKNSEGAQFYFSNLNRSYSSGYTGQCTWYAYGRANEILSDVGSNLKWDIANNAGLWYSTNLQNGARGFQSSSDYTKPKVGAIVVWKNAGAPGHVAIVEEVHANGTITISEANIPTKKSNSNPYGWQTVTLTLEEVHRRWKSYIFAGYIYLLES